MSNKELYLVRDDKEKNSADSGGKGNKIEVPRPTDIEDRFHNTIVGQKEAVKNFASLKKILESGIRQGKGPMHVEWLSGPSGVGKTEMVKKLIDVMLEDNPQYDEDGKLVQRAKAADYMVRIDGGSYQSEHEISKVLGAPPGYVGSGGPGNSFVEPILSQENIDRNSLHYVDDQGKDRQVCFILIDEAEKANQALFRSLLSSLDDGVMTLGNNKKVDLSNCVFLFTSNHGNKEVLEAKKSGDKRTSEEIYAEKYKEHFPPEFLGRVRKMTVFEHLSREEVMQIVYLRIDEIKKTFYQNGINFNMEITPEAVEWLIDRGYSKSEGARAMQKLMNDEIQNQLTLISGQYILEGRNIVVDGRSDSHELEFYCPDGDLETRPKVEKKPGRKTGPIPKTPAPKDNPRSSSGNTEPVDDPYGNPDSEKNEPIQDPDENPNFGRPNPETSKEDPDLVYRLDFYKSQVNSRVAETLNTGNITLLDNLCDAIIQWHQKRKNSSLDQAKTQVCEILRKGQNPYGNSSINNFEDLVSYIKDYCSKELNVSLDIREHCDKCDDHKH